MSVKQTSNVAQGASVKAAEKNVNNSILDKLNALSTLDNVKEKSGIKSIFKPQFSDKSNRSSARDKFYVSSQIFLAHLKAGKMQSAKTEFAKLKEIAEKYYLAESKFQSVSDYCNGNMREDKRQIIEITIEAIKDLQLA